MLSSGSGAMSGARVCHRLSLKVLSALLQHIDPVAKHQQFCVRIHICVCVCFHFPYPCPCPCPCLCPRQCPCLCHFHMTLWTFTADMTIKLLIRKSPYNVAWKHKEPLTCERMGWNQLKILASFPFGETYWLIQYKFQKYPSRWTFPLSSLLMVIKWQIVNSQCLIV